MANSDHYRYRHRNHRVIRLTLSVGASPSQLRGERAWDVTDSYRVRYAGRQGKRVRHKTFSLSQYWERAGVRAVVTDGAKVTVKLHDVISSPHDVIPSSSRDL
ncbi:MAG: hypothetical protein EA415_04385 [Sphaerobacteraceae bacterium]|nr:MAG: hypothetical protein EA415_04385 [Sphaerobacteraceae bacterium]